MLNAGADMSSVSTLLGHSSVQITEDAYAQWLIDPLQDEYDEVQERLNKNSVNKKDHYLKQIIINYLFKVVAFRTESSGQPVGFGSLFPSLTLNR
jgi:hypothetical protein